MSFGRFPRSLAMLALQLAVAAPSAWAQGPEDEVAQAPGAHTPAPPPEPGAPPLVPGGVAPDAGLEGDAPPDADVPPGEPETPEPSKGTDLLVSGILVTSAVTVIGGIAYINLLPKNYCNGDSDKNCRGRAQSWATNVGVLSLLGDGLGVFMIVEGARMRGEWQLWKEEHKVESHSSVRFGLTPLLAGGAAGTFEFRF